jgi:hypothetical protein
LSEAERDRRIKEYSSGRIGGVNLPYRNSDGKMASKIVINLGVDGFGKVLSSIFHEMAHNILNDLAGVSSASRDSAFIHEGVAEDFAIFALNELSNVYDNDPVLVTLAKRRQARVMKEKIGLNEYRYGFLLIETMRRRVSHNTFCGKVIPGLIEIVRGRMSVKGVSDFAYDISSDSMDDMRSSYSNL